MESREQQFSAAETERMMKAQEVILKAAAGGVRLGSQAYGAVRFCWSFQRLIVRYVAINQMIDVLDLQLDFSIHYSSRRNVA